MESPFMLFFAGTRDPLCNLGKLRLVLDRIISPKELVVVDGGEHSFKVLKSIGKTPPEVHAFIIKKTLEWIEQV